MSFRSYVDHGWQLCAIRPGSKAPDYPDWNTKPVPSDAADGLDGAGLLHALSGTCALDIDDLTAARAWWAARDIDLNTLLEAEDAVRIDSGRPNRAKLVYRLKKPLRTIRPQGAGFELRCATASGASVQDVLPPSIHPDTKQPYAWCYNEPLLAHWNALPNIPADLYRIWRGLIAERPMPAATAPAAAPVSRPALLEFYVSKRLASLNPDDYEDWIKAGQAAHSEDADPRGAFFAAWESWSQRSAKYQAQGPNSCRGKWSTFHQGGGRTVLGGNAPPAEAAEFPVANDEAASATEQAVAQASAVRRKDAQAALERRVAYVMDVDRYFDVERHKVLAGDHQVKHMFSHMMPLRKGTRTDPVKVLCESSTKTVVDSVAFHPGEGVLFNETLGGETTRYANIYRNRLPEPREPSKGELERVQWLFDRLDDVVFRDWLVQFFAHVVQRPGVKIKSAPLVWSETQGNGKTTILRVIPSLLCGPAYSREVNCAVLSSNFNDYLQNAWHINLAEFRAGTRGERGAISELLKQWIAEDVIVVHPKGLPAYTMRNRFFVTATSNHEDAAQIDNEDRRWAVHEMRAAAMTVSEQQYIYDEFLSRPEAAAALRGYFLNVDLAGFEPHAKPPVTDSRAQMVEASVSSEVEALRVALDERIPPFDRDVVTAREATEYVHRHSPMKPTMVHVGRVLAKPPFNGRSIVFRAGGGTYRAIILRNPLYWAGASGREIQAHLDGDEPDLLV